MGEGCRVGFCLFLFIYHSFFFVDFTKKKSARPKSLIKQKGLYTLHPYTLLEQIKNKLKKE
jgi:hypothetical protein